MLSEITTKVGLSGQVCSQRSQPRWVYQDRCAHRDHSQGGFIRTGVLTVITAKVGLSGQVCSQRSQPRWVYQDRCAHSDHSQGGFIRTGVLRIMTAGGGLRTLFLLSFWPVSAQSQMGREGGG